MFSRNDKEWYVMVEGISFTPCSSSKESFRLFAEAKHYHPDNHSVVYKKNSRKGAYHVVRDYTPLNVGGSL